MNPYADKKEIVRLYNAAYRAANKAQLKIAKAAYYQENKERIMQKVRDAKALDLEAARAKQRAYSAAHKAANIKKVRVSAKQWAERNKAHQKEVRAEYLARNPEYSIRNAMIRRDRGGVRPSKDITKKLYALQRGMCPCCARPLGNDYHRDHILPIALGGGNEDTNLQLLRKECNFKKHAKHPIDFMQERGFLL